VSADPGEQAGPPPVKPTADSLGIDLAAQRWQAAGRGDGAVEVAFVGEPQPQWVLLRVAGDPDGRVLVYDRHEWDCFLDGVRHGEFDDAARAH
jgi:Domain of unknown function (DUF397)